MRSTAQWWNDFKKATKQEARDYVDYWTLGHRRGEDATTESEDATTPADAITDTTPTQSVIEKVNTINDVVTNGVGATDVVTNGEGATTPNGVGIGVNPNGANGTTTTTTTASEVTPLDKYAETIRKSNEDKNKAVSDAYAKFQEAIKNGHSAYRGLVEKAMERKMQSAERKERDARSTALSNALGTLTNVFTASALAKKNGTIPIVSEHDKEPDSNLRKSIEGRYQMENENENFLIKMQEERRKHEADLAKGVYEREVAEASDKAKTEAAIAGKALDLAVEEQKFENLLERDKLKWNYKEASDYKIEEDGEVVKFAKGLYNGLKKKTSNKVGGVETGSSEQNYVVTKNDLVFANGVMDEARKVLGNSRQNDVMQAMNYLVLYYPEKVNDANYRNFIYNALKNKNVTLEQVKEKINEKANKTK